MGAICNAAQWLEYQLEVAVSELSRSDDLAETQGERSTSLIDRLKKLVNEGAVTETTAEASLRDLLSRIKAAMTTRDEIVHSTWMFTNDTKPGHVTA